MRTAEEKRIDTVVGQMIKARRMELGKSQSDISKYFGFSFQQLQKIENGSNRVGAGRLYQIAQLLDCPVSYFYLPLREEETPQHDRSSLALMKMFHKMPANLKKKVLGIVRVLS